MTTPTPEQRRRWRAEREAFDSAVAEAIARAGPGRTEAERAMAPAEFCAHLNAQLRARRQAADTTPPAA